MSSSDMAVAQLIQNMTMTLATLGHLMPEWPSQATIKNGSRFDWIVVGAGSAGAVLAGRLSEDPARRVLLLEAGGDPPIQSVVPGAAPLLLHDPKYDWNYYSVDDNVTSQGQKEPGRVAYPRGKTLGGCSSVNYMYYVRGNRRDFDEWADAGFEGWDYDAVLPYFKKSEKYLETELFDENPEDALYHNTSGPMKVSIANWPEFVEAKLDSVIQSLEEIGFEKGSDCNGVRQLGITRSIFTHSKPKNSSSVTTRSSTAKAFLVPATNRSNLFVLKNTMVTRIILESNRATGVEAILNNQSVVFFANSEVIVSCGALNTPKLLIASGIGPRKDLEDLGVDVIADLPVGCGMQDHAVVPLLLIGESNKTNKGPPVTSLNSLPFANVISFFTFDGEERPQFEMVSVYFEASSPVLYLVCTLVFGYSNETCNRVGEINLESEVYVFYMGLLHPKSRGLVKITSVDPAVPPEIHTGFLTDPDDVELFKSGIDYILNMSGTTYFKGCNGSFVDMGFTQCDDLEFMSNEYWDCYVRNGVISMYHPSATTAMGHVVDKDLKVYNISGLRVVDTGVFPTITSGNTNAPTIMLAERAADLIKQDSKLCSICFHLDYSDRKCVSKEKNN